MPTSRTVRYGCSTAGLWKRTSRRPRTERRSPAPNGGGAMTAIARGTSVLPAAPGLVTSGGPAPANTLSANLTGHALFLAGHAVWGAAAGEGSRVHHGGAACPGVGHGFHGHNFQRGGHGAAEAIAVSRSAAPAGDMGEKPLAKSLSNVRRAGKFPGVAKAEPRGGADGSTAGGAHQPHRRAQRTHCPGGTQSRARHRRPVP